MYALADSLRSLPGRSYRRTSLAHYATDPPSPQAALDLFRGEWISRLPEPFSHLEAGSLPLFEDPRLFSGVQSLGGVEGKSVVELGPLEGGHTYRLEKLGASRIVAVEANARAYHRCLIIKEILSLTRAHFLYGDFIGYLRESGESFDLCVASGVLYHMQNPVELLELIARAAEQLILWTHYYDEAVISKLPRRAAKFRGSSTHEYAGFPHVLYRQEYRSRLFSRGYCGGTATHSHWMTREDIVAGLAHFGMEATSLEIDPAHPNGPSLLLTAVKRPG
ncbi:MAG: class I SAM-dependent methyltransferase [Gemmatimonadota bacterium]|nr:class I SAM-dependent methyltransferase [Gemmatimonadota bacterium]